MLYLPILMCLLSLQAAMGLSPHPHPHHVENKQQQQPLQKQHSPENLQQAIQRKALTAVVAVALLSAASFALPVYARTLTSDDLRALEKVVTKAVMASEDRMNLKFENMDNRFQDLEKSQALNLKDLERKLSLS